METTIEVAGLRKRFGRTLALDGMTFTVSPGQVTGFIGPNGAGKSTTMRVILGLDAPDAGQALIGGRPYASLRDPLTRVGALLDAAALQPSRTARNHLLWLAHSQGLGARRVDEVIALAGLRDAARRKAGGYSLGMRQRLGIAAALLGNPPALMLDEPFNGMDPEGIVWVRGFLAALAAEGRAVLVSSHLMSELQEIASHLVIVGRGTVIADTSVAELLASASGDQVTVRTSAPQDAMTVLANAGAEVTATGPDALMISGISAERTVALLTANRLSFAEVTAHRATLEEAYMELTRDARGSHRALCRRPEQPVPVRRDPGRPGGEAVTDTFYFVHRPLTTDGSITARVTSLTEVAESGTTPQGGAAQTQPALVPWSKAGLIVTAGPGQGSAYAAVMVTGGHGTRMQWNYTGDAPGLAGGVAAASPRWLRLTRAGDVITGYDSADGTNWSTIGAVTLPGLAPTVQAGLFATSPGSARTTSQQVTSASGTAVPTDATATFDRVGLAGGWPGGSWTGTAVRVGGVSSYITGHEAGYRQAGGVFTVTGSGDLAPDVTDGTPIDVLLAGLFLALVAVLVVGAQFMTAEYRRGLIRLTLAASPRRGRALAAKAIVLGAVTFTAGLAAAAGAVLIGRPLLRASGNSVYPVTALTEARVIVGTAALVAVFAVFALGVGATLASTGWLLLAAATLTVAVSVAAVTATECPSGGCAADPAKISLTGIYLGQAVVAVLAVMAVSGEYSSGMVSLTLTAMPRRLTVLAAKAAVLTGLVLITGTIAVLGSLLAGGLILPGHGIGPAHGYPALSVGDGPVVRAAFGSVLYLALVGPMTAGLAIQATTGLNSLPISPWAGLGVLAAWAAGALLLGGLLLRVRDA